MSRRSILAAKGRGGSSDGARSAVIQRALQPPMGGRPLPAPVRTKMETALGHDFSKIRVHEGEQAPSVGAQAFARGSHLFFAPGLYRPGTTAGQRLIGHELTHVVQQRAGRVRATEGGAVPVNADPALEREADRLGARAAEASTSSASANGARAAATAGAAASAGAAVGGGAAAAPGGGGVAQLSRNKRDADKELNDALSDRQKKAGLKAGEALVRTGAVKYLNRKGHTKGQPGASGGARAQTHHHGDEVATKAAVNKAIRLGEATRHDFQSSAKRTGGAKVSREERLAEKDLAREAAGAQQAQGSAARRRNKKGP